MNKKLEHLLKEYEEFLISEGSASHTTIKKYLIYIKEGFVYLNIHTVEDVKNLNYIRVRQEWLNIRREELSGASLNIRIVSLKSFLNYLVGRRIVKDNIANLIKPFPVNVREVEMDEDKIKNMLVIVDEEYKNKPCYITIRDKFIINMLLFIGLRQSELRNIELDDVSFTDGEFTVIGKRNKARTVYIPSNLMKLYREYLFYRNQIETEDNHLFVSVRGKKLDKNMVTNLVKRISNKAGLSYVAHSLRGVCCSLLIESGIPIAEVSVILGHSNTDVTLKHYYKPSKKNTKSNIDKNILLNII